MSFLKCNIIIYILKCNVYHNIVIKKAFEINNNKFCVSVRI